VTEELDAVVFDAGKTLWDFKYGADELFSQALQRQGISADRTRLSALVKEAERRFDEHYSKVDDPGQEKPIWVEFGSFVLDGLGVAADRERFTDDCSEIFGKAVDDVSNWKAYPDAIPTLDALRARGFRLGMISNASELARRVLRNLDMERRFDFVVISSEVGMRKPSPEIFRMAMRQAGVHPHRALYVGDRLAIDVKGARRAGMQAVLIDREDIYPDADAIRIKDLNGLTRFL